MKIKFAILAVMIFLAIAFASSPAYAQQCLTEVATSTSVSTATTGTDVAITVTTTGTSCTVSTLSLVSSPSLTINDPASGQYSGFSAGTTKTFTVTAGTAGTYSYYARGTTSSGSVDATQTNLEFISPSDMTVTATPSSQSLTHNSMFNLTVTVENSQASDVSTSYTLNLPSGLTRNSGNPASSSGTTISASSTKSLTFEIKHSTCFTGSKSVTFDLGDSTGAASITITGNSSCDTGSSSSSSSSSSSGGGGATVVSEAHTFAQITPGVVAVKKYTNTALGLKEISIDVSNTANNVRIVVTKLAGQPASVSSISGTTFQYLEINVSNLPSTSLNKAVLTFEVSKSWLSSNGFSNSEVALRRWDGSSWESLPTAQVSEDANNVKYQSTLSSFSTFAIIGEKAAAAPVTPTPEAGEQPETTAPAAGEEAPSEQQPFAGLPPIGGLDSLGVALVLIIVLVVGFYYFYHWKKKKD